MGRRMTHDPSLLGGVRVALADVSGNGIPDILTVPGPGGPPLVRLGDRSSATPLRGSLPTASDEVYTRGP